MRNHLAIVALLGFWACSPPVEGEQVIVEKNDGAVEKSVEPSSLDSPIVTRGEFASRNLRWPLTVESGRLGCTRLARWIEVDGTKYGLNGSASVARGYAEIEPIWQVDQEMAAQLNELGAPNDPPLRINIGDMIQEAGQYCE